MGKRTPAEVKRLLIEQLRKRNKAEEEIYFLTFELIDLLCPDEQKSE